MALVALGGALAVLGIYATALFFALQHIGERYSPAVNGVFLKRFALAPSAAFAILVILIGLLAIVPAPTPPATTTTICCVGPAELLLSPFQISYLTLVGLFITVAIALFDGWKLSTRLGDVVLLVTLVRDLPAIRRMPALQVIVLNAVRRSDVIATAAALTVAKSAGTKELTLLLNWLTDHRELLATDWLTHEVLTAVVSGTLTDMEARTYQSTLERLLGLALDREAFPRGVEVIDRTLDALSRTPRWGLDHGMLLYHLGFLLWHVGDPGASVPRKTAVQAQLEAVQSYFLVKLRAVWQAVTEKGPESVKNYVLGIDRLLQDVQDDDFLSLIDEWLDDGFRKGLLVPEALVDLARALRRTQENLRSGDSSADDLVMLIAAILVQLGGPREARQILRMRLSGKTPHETLVQTLRARALENVRTITPEQWLAADEAGETGQASELPPLLNARSVDMVEAELAKSGSGLNGG